MLVGGELRIQAMGGVWINKTKIRYAEISTNSRHAFSHRSASSSSSYSSGYKICACANGRLFRVATNSRRNSSASLGCFHLDKTNNPCVWTSVLYSFSLLSFLVFILAQRNFYLRFLARMCDPFMSPVEVPCSCPTAYTRPHFCCRVTSFHFDVSIIYYISWMSFLLWHIWYTIITLLTFFTIIV